MLKKLKQLYATTSSSRFKKYLEKKGVTIGENVYFKNCKKMDIDLSNPMLIEIGDNVFFNRDFTLLTHDAVSWIFRIKYKDFVPNSIGKVKIGNNVHFARNVTVLRGVTIGDNVFIGHSSLVTKDIPPNCIAAGSPAKVVCTLDDYYKRSKARCVDELKEYCDIIREKKKREPTIKDFGNNYEIFVSGDKLDDYWEKANKNKDRAKRRLMGHYENYKKNHVSIYNNFEHMLEDCQ